MAFKIDLRQGEQIALRSDDIDWERVKANYGKTSVQNKKGHSIISATP
jgi:hypothetical protein